MLYWMKQSVLITTLLFPTLAPLLLAGDSPSPSPASGFQADFLGQINWVEKEIVDLEQAMPQEKFTWRPAEGVRSVSEVYMHMAFSNYLLFSFMGYEPPAGITLTGDIMADAKNWEATTTDKGKIADILRKSMDHVRATAPQVTDLEKKVDFFGQSLTLRSMMMNVLEHLHEHLGQSIAYARMNGVVPPWSAKQ